MATSPEKEASSSKNHLTLEDKFRFSLNDDSSTPDGTEKVVAAALRAILGKQKQAEKKLARAKGCP